MNIRKIIFLAIFLAVSVVYILSTTDQVFMLSTLHLIFPVGAALIAAYTSRIYGFKSANNGRVQLIIAAGLVSWGIAEVVGYVLDNFLDVANLIPRVDSFFFLIAYPILGMGVYRGYVTAGIKLKLVKKSLLMMVLSASALLTIAVAYFGVYKAYDPTADILTNVVNLGYGLGDLILVVGSLFAIVVAHEYGDGKLASFWKTMAAGFFTFLIGDTLFFTMYGALVMEGVKPYLYVNLIWAAAYMLLAYAVLENYIHILSVQKNIKLQLQQRK